MITLVRTPHREAPFSAQSRGHGRRRVRVVLLIAAGMVIGLLFTLSLKGRPAGWSRGCRKAKRSSLSADPPGGPGSDSLWMTTGATILSSLRLERIVLLY